MSASLVVVLGGSVTAAADPDPADPAAGEARPDPGALPGHRGSFEIGAGFSSDEEFLAEAAVRQPDLFGTGDSLALTAHLSALDQRFMLRFVDPHLLGGGLTLDARLYDDRRVLPGFARDAVGGDVRLGHALGRHVRGWVGYRLEHLAISPDATTVPEVLARGAGGAGPPPGEGLVSALEAGVAYDTRDAPLLPRHGSSLGASLEVADPHLGSDLAFTRVRGWASTNQPIGPVTLHLAGSVTAIGSPGVLPLSERLFLDGASDVRGYLPGGVGPIGPLGAPVGGDLKLVGHASLEVPIYRGISVEGFFDAARISDLTVESPYGLAHGSAMSAGFGVIWRSPIGPITLDVAFPLDGRGPSLVFGIGGAF